MQKKFKNVELLFPLVLSDLDQNFHETDAGTGTCYRVSK